jgi:hypothetical protein
MMNADFWEDIAVRLGMIEREIGVAFKGAKNDAYGLLQTEILRSAVAARRLRDAAIIEQWEIERRNMPVKLDGTAAKGGR